jgi:hypothetical protein
VNISPVTLGNKLKAQREHRGFTLQEVAATTKIPVTLLEALERDDLTRWPQGLYRRAFFRSYLMAVGLPMEPLAAEFARLHCDDAPDGAPAGPAERSAETHVADGRLALTLASADAAVRRTWRSVAIALLELLGVVAAGYLVAWAGGMTALAGTGVAALVYYPFTRIVRARAVSTTPRALNGPMHGASTAAAASPPNTQVAAAASLIDRARVREWPSQCVRSVRWLATRTRPYAAGGLRAGQRSWRAMMYGAGATHRRLSPVISRTVLVLLAAARALGRGSVRAARETSRQLSRTARTVNRSFWSGVRIAGEYAQSAAARHLNPTRE